MDIKKFKETVKDALKSRFFVVLLLINLVQMIILLIIAITNIRTGLTVKTHCEVSGSVPTCSTAEAQWYYILNFVALPIVEFVVNVAVSLKLLAMKGRQLALCWLWLMLLVGLVVTVLAATMLTHVVEL